MKDAATRYPLAWPVSWKRTTSGNRQTAKFRKGAGGYVGPADARRWQSAERLTIGDGIKRVSGEMRRLGVRDGDWLISSDVPTRLDGLPYANAAQPKDPGVAVYFRIGAKREPRVLACDRWNRVADNLAAIAGHVEAIRMQDRYGVGTLEQAFAGYAAIPAKTGGADWRAELGLTEHPVDNLATVEARYRELARARHPDSGGSHEAMARLNEAREAARLELNGQQ
jgi:hypothetical protein